MNKDNKSKIIFLDVDGVLNCYSTMDRCGRYIGISDKKVSLLKDIVTATKADIILVSTWKEYWNKDSNQKHLQDYMANYLDEKLNKQGLMAIDKTDDHNSYYRGEGILKYLDNQKKQGKEVDKFIIIDDEMFDYEELGLTKYLIKTSFYHHGLDIGHVKKAINKLL